MHDYYDIRPPPSYHTVLAVGNDVHLMWARRGYPDATWRESPDIRWQYMKYEIRFDGFLCVVLWVREYTTLRTCSACNESIIYEGIN